MYDTTKLVSSLGLPSVDNVNCSIRAVRECVNWEAEFPPGVQDARFLGRKSSRCASPQ